MFLFRKKKELESRYPPVEPIRIEGFPPIPPYMGEKINVFLNNPFFIKWMEECVALMVKEINAMKHLRGPSKDLKIFRMFMIGCEMDKIWFENFLHPIKYEDYHLKTVIGEEHEAMCMAIIMFLREKLDQTVVPNFKDLNLKYSTKHRKVVFYDSDHPSYYEIAFTFSINNPAYEKHELYDW